MRDEWFFSSIPHVGADPLAAVAAAAAAGGAPAGPYLPPSHALPPGHPLLTAAREQELAYRDLLSRPPYSTDPVLAHQAVSNLVRFSCFSNNIYMLSVT